jgi:hypothetical protein
MIPRLSGIIGRLKVYEVSLYERKIAITSGFGLFEVIEYEREWQRPFGCR